MAAVWLSVSVAFSVRNREQLANPPVLADLKRGRYRAAYDTGEWLGARWTGACRIKASIQENATLAAM